MTDGDTVTSDVVVAVDPTTAFHAFTAEIDLWWRRGPINFWSDAHRVVEIRCEAGVGGRIVEVLDDHSGDTVFERARITAWESANDDVTTEVTFLPVEGGTRVTVEHRIPVGGVDQGGTAWSRVVPKWFGPWVAARDRAPHEQRDVARLMLGVYYRRPAAAARWLADAFGFTPDGDLPTGDDPLPRTGYGHPWIEFRVGNALLHVFPLDEPAGDGPVLHTHVPWVYVDDLDAHYAHARASGAVIVEEPHPYPGSLVYVADDPEGNRWQFSQARVTQW
jgi:uncharacterized glyoxalase superfamily protein PhnB